MRVHVASQYNSPRNINEFSFTFVMDMPQLDQSKIGVSMQDILIERFMKEMKCEPTNLDVSQQTHSKVDFVQFAHRCVTELQEKLSFIDDLRRANASLERELMMHKDFIKNLRITMVSKDD